MVEGGEFVVAVVLGWVGEHVEGSACSGYAEAFAQDVEGSAALFFWGCEFGDEPVEQPVFLGLPRGGV